MPIFAQLVKVPLGIFSAINKISIANSFFYYYTNYPKAFHPNRLPPKGPSTEHKPISWTKYNPYEADLLLMNYCIEILLQTYPSLQIQIVCINY